MSEIGEVFKTITKTATVGLFTIGFIYYGGNFLTHGRLANDVNKLKADIKGIADTPILDLESKGRGSPAIPDPAPGGGLDETLEGLKNQVRDSLQKLFPR